MSFTLLWFEVESRGEKPKRLALATGQPLSTFGSFAALGLHSCRALSSAHCAENLNDVPDHSTKAKTLRCHGPRQKTKRSINDFTNPPF